MPYNEIYISIYRDSLMPKIRLKGPMPDREQFKKKLVKFDGDVLARIEKEIDYDSISSLVHFLFLHYLGEINLKKENHIDVKDFFEEK